MGVFHNSSYFNTSNGRLRPNLSVMKSFCIMIPEVAAVHQNMATRLLLHSFILIFVATAAAGTSPEPYLDHHRDALNLNLITMGCLEATSGRSISNAVFFLNGSTVLYNYSNHVDVDEERVIERVIPDDDNRIVFVINRRAEGDFSCAVRIGTAGNIIRSKSVPVVVLPSPRTSHVPPQSLFFSKVGSQARIKCPQKPGALVSKYHGKWTNSNTSQVLIGIQKPAVKVYRPPIHDLRYSIDRSSFSLLIDDVLLSDSGSWYQCELIVESPQDRFTEYTYGASMNLELLVYKPPTITIAPDSKVVSATLVANIMSFICEAVGFASPIITWRHLDKNVTSDLKYRLNESYFSTGEGEFGTRSILLIRSIEILDTGPVQCLADAAPSVETNHLQLPGDTMTASLTVLGTFDSLAVFITTTQDAIFVLTYPIVFLVPVRLQLIYYEQNGEEGGGLARSSLVKTSKEYNNTSQISHIAFNKYVPYNKFQVEISLVYGSVVGTGGDTRLVYDKTIPSSIQSPSLKVLLPSILLPIVITILICTLVIVVSMCYMNGKILRQNKKRFEQLDSMERLLCEKEKCQTEGTEVQLRSNGQCQTVVHMQTVRHDGCTISPDKPDKMELAKRYAKVLKLITQYGNNDPDISHFMYK